MSRKVFNYASAIVTAVGSVAEASAVFFGWGAAISASIPVGDIVTIPIEGYDGAKSVVLNITE